METIIYGWLATNWQSALLALILAFLFVRLGRYFELQNLILRRLNRLIRLHCDRHPEHAVKILGDFEEEEQKKVEGKND